MEKIAVIVAGGSGSRMQSEIPKQFIELNGLPILMHTINRFAKLHIKIRIVLPESQFSIWKELVTKHQFTIPYKLFKGGKTRFHSVKNGLENISPSSFVAIHDGVRPFVNSQTINTGFTVAEKNGAAVPVIDIHESIRELSELNSKAINRENYRLVQTPQIFQGQVILKAYEQNYTGSFTDDASVVETMGQKITLFDGNRENIKITTSNDLLIAEAYARNWI